MQSQQKHYSQRTDLSRVEQELCLTVLDSKLIADDTQVDKHIVEQIILSLIDEWRNNKDKSFNDLIEGFDYPHIEIYAQWFFSLSGGERRDDQACVLVAKIKTIFSECKNAIDSIDSIDSIDLIYKLTSALKSTTGVGKHEGFAEQIGKDLLSSWTTSNNMAKPLSTIIENFDLTATVTSQYMKVKIKGLPDREQSIQLNKEERSKIAAINTSIKERLMQTNQHIKQIDKLTSKLKSTKAGKHDGLVEQIGEDLLSIWATSDNIDKPLSTIIENLDFTGTITAQYIKERGESLSEDVRDRIAEASIAIKGNIKVFYAEMTELEKPQENKPNAANSPQANGDKNDQGFFKNTKTAAGVGAGGAPATPKSSH